MVAGLPSPALLLNCDSFILQEYLLQRSQSSCSEFVNICELLEVRDGMSP